MKKYIFIPILMLAVLTVKGQQASVSENYFTDKYSLAPSYAGGDGSGSLVIGYRSDWSGIEGGPKTLRLSYNGSIMERAGYGAKFILDKAGIFNQLYLMGSYSYRLTVGGDNDILFGLSAGIYNNTVNLSEYYNDPDFDIDPALISGDVRSAVKFMSDFSVVYKRSGIEAGFLFSNISFGDAKYSDVDMVYNPMSNIQFHATYLYKINEAWKVEPLAILRAGKIIKSQFEVAARAIYSDMVWGSLLFRDPGIIGAGVGTSAVKGLTISYNFNYALNVATGALNNHEITIAVNLPQYFSKKGN